MTLFKNRSSDKENLRTRVIRTCCEGEVIDISKVSNSAISSMILGEGFGVICSKPEIVSPVDGIIKDVSDGGHSYAIQTIDGISIIVCITASSREEKLAPEVVVGQMVDAGDLLCRKENAEVSVIITNTEIFSKYKIAVGKAKSNSDGVVIYEL
ncbi:MAG: PTS glucose transporter subunit IIA [Ruminococcus sp.]|nr:PTS glucose transporter subunit IIA [Ruminococcus sp.]